MYSRTTIGITVGLAALLIVGAIVLGKIFGSEGETRPAASPTTTVTAAPRTGPVALVPVEAPEAASTPCTDLIAALPRALTSGSSTLVRLPLAEPAPPATEAWGDRRADPVVLRCGLARPPELTPTSGLREISGVKWLSIPGDSAATWYLVDRAVYAALTVPATAGTGPLQGISEAVAKTLTPVPVRAG